MSESSAYVANATIYQAVLWRSSSRIQGSFSGLNVSQEQCTHAPADGSDMVAAHVVQPGLDPTFVGIGCRIATCRVPLRLRESVIAANLTTHYGMDNITTVASLLATRSRDLIFRSPHWHPPQIVWNSHRCRLNTLRIHILPAGPACGPSTTRSLADKSVNHRTPPRAQQQHPVSNSLQNCSHCTETTTPATAYRAFPSLGSEC